jgi:predicted phosphohydrolase
VNYLRFSHQTWPAVSNLITSGHTRTLTVEQLIVILNERVDQFIASDDKVYNRYIKNLRRSLDSLNEDERKLVMSVYDVRQKTGE